MDVEGCFVFVERRYVESVSGPHALTVWGSGPSLSQQKWIWKSQCNERWPGEGRVGWGARVQKMFLASASAARSPSFWKMDRVTLRASAPTPTLFYLRRSQQVNKS